MKHKFKVGEIVAAAPKATRHIPRGTYEIVRRLPVDEKGLQYQVKSLEDGHQRTVHERDLMEVER
jgi:hypothetical protein